MDSRTIFNELTRRHSDYIRFVLSKYFPNTMEQDDVFQDFMIHLMEKVEDLDPNHPEPNIKGWISVVARNFCISIFRKRNKKNTIKYKDFENESLIDNYRDNYLTENTINSGGRSTKIINIEKMLAQLNERDRQIIVLYFLKKYSHREIEAIMNLKNSSLYVRRAIDKLKTLEKAESFFEYFDDFQAI